jgi:hypothetical protein
LIGYVVRAGRQRWLVWVNAPALWVPLAGLIGFDAPFCCEAKADSPPAAAGSIEPFWLMQLIVAAVARARHN